MRKTIAVLAVLPLLPVVAAEASSNDPAVTKASTKTITIGDDFFKPKTITVKKGTTLQFEWGKNNTGTLDEHNVAGVTGNKFKPTPDTTKPSKPFKKKFTKNSLVVCTIHSTVMKLKVKVK
jgi:plastocyanin